MDFKYFCTNGGGLCTRCRFLFLWLFSAGNAILYIIRDFPRRKDRFRGIANRISGHCGRPSGRSGDIAGDSIVLPAVRTPPVTSVRTGDTPLTSAGGKDAYRIRPRTIGRYLAVLFHPPRSGTTIHHSSSPGLARQTKRGDIVSCILPLLTILPRSGRP